MGRPLSNLDDALSNDLHANTKIEIYLVTQYDCTSHGEALPICAYTREEDAKRKADALNAAEPGYGAGYLPITLNPDPPRLWNASKGA